MGEPLAPNQPDSTTVTPHVDSLQSLLVEEIENSSDVTSGSFSELPVVDFQPAPEFSQQPSEFAEAESSSVFQPEPFVSDSPAAPEQVSSVSEKSPQVTVNHYQNPPAMMDLNEMNQFANSPDLSLPLKYDLVISGVDTESEVGILSDALTDHRLGLDRQAIMESLVNGQVRIHNLNPVKASILFQRLRFDPFAIEVIEKKI